MSGALLWASCLVGVLLVGVFVYAVWPGAKR